MSEIETQNFITEALARALIVGGSVGALGGLYFMDLRTGFTLGVLSGFFAGVTRLMLLKKMKKNK